MEYIISKNISLPEDISGMERPDWFNMWKNKQFPYRNLEMGDFLYWYDTKKKSLVWKSIVVKIERQEYSDKRQITEKYRSPSNDEYLGAAPNKGYFLLYNVKIVKKINVPKPLYDFARLGWEEFDIENKKRWFNGLEPEDKTTIDNIITPTKEPILKKLYELNNWMQSITPEKIKKIISTTIRNDTKFIKTLKEAANYKCQFPDCGIQIKKRGGGFYIEVAHIQPISKDGQSVLGNLIVLCPNHHKEFDFGDLKINERTQSLSEISGLLNGVAFSIKLDFDSN